MYPNWGRKVGETPIIYRPKIEQLLIQKAHNKVASEIRAGRLPRLRAFIDHPPSTIVCVDCGTRLANCYDHRDYSQPLKVDPVCTRCNMHRGPGIFSKLTKLSPAERDKTAVA